MTSYGTYERVAGGSEPVASSWRQVPRCGCKALSGFAVLLAASIALAVWSSHSGGHPVEYHDSPISNDRVDRWDDKHAHKFRPRFPIAEGHRKDCEDKDFTKDTLKVIKETNFVNAMLNSGFDASLLDKFEASDIIGFHDDDKFFIVFDNSYQIGLVRRHGLNPGAHLASPDENLLLDWPEDSPMNPDGDSQFEAIAHNHSADTFLIFEETHLAKDNVSRSRAHEVHISAQNNITSIRTCEVEYEFSFENKGIEGATVVEIRGRTYVLALCEGNYCEGGEKGREPGNGRILLLEQYLVENGNKSSCTYNVVQTIKLPKEVDFMDYSAITVYENRKVAITSQENAAVWIAELDFPDTVGPKPSKEDNDDDDDDDDNDDDEPMVAFVNGKIYDFPRNDLCEIVYCNIEGAYFLKENILITVSDAMKGKGRQPYVCRSKGQSIHVFYIPE